MAFELLRNKEAFSPTGEAANDYTEQVVRGFVHKMNNLLTVFHGYSSLMVADQKLDDDTRDCIQEIKNAADGTSDLLARLVTVARKPSAHATTINLREFLDNHCRSLESLVVAPAVFEVGVDETHVVTTDPSILKQALTAIVTNAAQALDGEGTVRIESIDDGDTVRILVFDDGDGFSTDLQERIFEPFFSHRKQMGCLGLGLPTARHAMGHLGGSIAIASEPGEGTCAHLTLPKG